MPELQKAKHERWSDKLLHQYHSNQHRPGAPTENWSANPKFSGKVYLWITHSARLFEVLCRSRQSQRYLRYFPQTASQIPGLSWFTKEPSSRLVLPSWPCPLRAEDMSTQRATRATPGDAAMQRPSRDFPRYQAKRGSAACGTCTCTTGFSWAARTESKGQPSYLSSWMNLWSSFWAAIFSSKIHQKHAPKHPQS